MPNSRNPIVDSVRILPKDTDFLDRKVGNQGEVFFDPTDKTLRIFDGIIPGGIPLLKADLTNAQGVIGAALGDNPPTGENVQAGTIWFNTSNGRLYILFDDGTSTQWVQPTTPSYGAGGGGGGAAALTELSDVAVTTPTTGQVLKYNGTAWVNGTDNTGGGGGAGATTLDELTDVVVSSPSSSQVLSYNGTAWVNTTLAATGVTSITAGDNITISGNTGDITIAATSSSTRFDALTDAVATSLTIDQVAYQAITRLDVTNTGATAYNFSQYSSGNPTVYVISGTTIAFKLRCTGHPFAIQDPTGTNYNTGLVHVSLTGTVSTGSSAQGKSSGTLYWQVPYGISGGYRYQCTAHVPMVGSLFIKDISAL